MTPLGPVVGGLVTAVLVSTQFAVAEVRYTVADLGTLGGSKSVAGSINNKGQVVGWADPTGDPYTYHAFLWKGSGPLQDLGTLGGPESRAYGINDGGEIVGWSDMPGVSYSQHGFRTHPNMPINLATDDLGPSGVAFSTAQSINSAGQVVGSVSVGSGASEVSHAYRTAPGSPINLATDDLGTLGGGNSEATDINDRGQVVGRASTPGNTSYHAFLYSGSGPMQDLGTLGGAYSRAFAINSLEQIVGDSSPVDDGNGHACLWQRGVPHDLGTLGGRISQAVDINESGTIIGWSEVTGQSLPHPFVYANSQMRDLNELIDPASGWMLSVATGINDVGQIVGAGYHDNGSMHAFLLTPIPEPAALSLLVLGGLAVMRPRRNAG